MNNERINNETPSTVTHTVTRPSSSDSVLASANTMLDAHKVPEKWLLLIALCQGLVLLYLHQAMEFDYWPHYSPSWLLAIYTVALVLPLCLMFCLDQRNMKTLWKWVLPFAGIVGVLGFYSGPFILVRQNSFNGDFIFTYILTMGLASFKTILYIQQFTSQRSNKVRPHYSSLFLYSWRNAISFALAGLFTLACISVFGLWAALFNAIGIEFFKELFSEEWFYYPATCLSYAIGVMLCRKLAHIIDTVARIQQVLLKLLLVITSVISILFLSALMFTGLDPLWEQGGSRLILSLQVLMLFFVNAVYKDEYSDRPYPLYLHRLIYIAVATFTIYSAISFYGLSLRIDQHGLSVARCWALLLEILLSCFALGYLIGIVCYRDRWLRAQSMVNISMGLIFMLAMLLVNSPILDFRKLVASNMYQRLVSGQVEIEEFDLRYVERNLSLHGQALLTRLESEYKDTYPEITLRINALKSPRQKNQETQEELSVDEFKKTIHLVKGQPSLDLYATLKESVYQKPNWEMQDLQQLYLYGIDLNKDQEDEFILFLESNTSLKGDLFVMESGSWERYSDQINIYKGVQKEGRQYQSFLDSKAAMLSGELEVTPPRWQDIQFNGVRYEFTSKQAQ